MDDSGSAGSVWRSVNSTAIQKIWAVTSNGNAFYFELEGDSVKTTKKWTGILGGGGTRTYVTEGGLIAARFPNIYFIDPDGTPEGPIPNDNKKAIAANQRICLTSYKKNGQRFMLGAWGTGNYIEYQLDDTPPYKPLWDDASTTKDGTINLGTNWGYNCFIDQKRMTFYSAWFASKTIGALDLNSLTIASTAAPNASFESSNIAGLTNGTRGPTSYAMAGDANGNVINGTSAYTAAHDTVSDTIWVSMRGRNEIGLFPAACFSSTQNCQGFGWYQPTFNGNSIRIGPMSALKDGRIVGATRSVGGLYVLSLTDPSNRTKGVTVVKIADLAGDPYMYTDFTGATLYVTDYQEIIELSEAPLFNAAKPIKKLSYRWTPKAGKSTDWRSMKLEIRCFQDDASKSDFTEVVMPGTANTYHPVTINSCDGKVANRVEVRVSQKNNETTLIDLDRIEIGIDQ